MVAATVGVVVLPSRLLGSERRAELPLPRAPRASVIQAHVIRVPARRPHITTARTVVFSPPAARVTPRKTIAASFVVHRTKAPRHVVQPTVTATKRSKPAPTPATTPAPAPTTPDVTVAPPATIVTAAKPVPSGVAGQAAEAKAQKKDAHPKPQQHGFSKQDAKKQDTKKQDSKQAAAQAPPVQSQNDTAGPQQQSSPPDASHDQDHGPDHGDGSQHGHGHHQ